MAFKKRDAEVRKPEMTSLIDAVFLLLIFFLVASISGAQKAASRAERQEEVLVDIGELELARNLPRPAVTAPALSDTLFHLLIQVQEVEGVQDSLVLFLLDEQVRTMENMESDTTETEFGYPGTYFGTRGPYAFQDRQGHGVPGAIKRIADRIDFIQNHVHPDPKVEVRAHKRVSYGQLVNIFRLCEEKGIKGLEFWVLKGRSKTVSAGSE